MLRQLRFPLPPEKLSSNDTSLIHLLVIIKSPGRPKITRLAEKAGELVWLAVTGPRPRCIHFLGRSIYIALSRAGFFPKQPSFFPLIHATLAAHLTPAFISFHRSAAGGKASDTGSLLARHWSIRSKWESEHTSRFDSINGYKQFIVYEKFGAAFTVRVVVMRESVHVKSSRAGGIAMATLALKGEAVLIAFCTFTRECAFGARSRFERAPGSFFRNLIDTVTSLSRA